MLYSRLTETELERAVFIDPANTAARFEMLRRLPAVFEKHADDLADLQQELTTANGDHAAEMEVVRDDLRDAEKHASDLGTELAAANDFIAKLTFAEDLV